MISVLTTEENPLQLSELAARVGGTLVGKDRTVRSLVLNSSKAGNESLFCAVKGAKVDGHTFIEDAKKRGASAVLVEEVERRHDLPAIVVNASDRAAGILAGIFAGDPSAKIDVVGVTGTNGKTTSNWLVFEALSKLGKKTLRMGTLGSFIPGILSDPDTLTTPDPLTVQATLRTALQGGVTACVMEASSHALHQGRLEGIDFDVGIFTNLTRDHLDFHKTMEAYFEAKMRLFERIALSKKLRKASVINLDGDFGVDAEARANSLGLQSFSVGVHDDAVVKITHFSQTLAGSTLSLVYHGSEFSIRTKLIGAHNASNLAGVFAALCGLGIPPGESAHALEGISLVPGRLQQVEAPGFGIYVDYAHTPDALENVLKTLRPIVKNNLWIVFGCGGDRDRGKRPQMAEIATRLGDKVIITSDNPRTEDPQAILNEIVLGAKDPYLVEVDRARAITEAIRSAQEGDVVLIAGKGHEDYQIIGTTKTHFSDVEVATLAVKQR